jgi:hypothetical protein
VITGCRDRSLRWSKVDETISVILARDIVLGTPRETLDLCQPGNRNAHSSIDTRQPSLVMLILRLDGHGVHSHKHENCSGFNVEGHPNNEQSTASLSDGSVASTNEWTDQGPSGT